MIMFLYVTDGMTTKCSVKYAIVFPGEVQVFMVLQGYKALWEPSSSKALCKCNILTENPAFVMLKENFVLKF